LILLGITKLSKKNCNLLIAACCALGAQSVIDDELQVENMRKFGELIHLRFKTTICLIILMAKVNQLDIKEQMTLPLIHF
jgi:octaprenyl-diphosphate synthase